MQGNACADGARTVEALDEARFHERDDDEYRVRHQAQEVPWILQRNHGESMACADKKVCEQASCAVDNDGTELTV